VGITVTLNISGGYNGDLYAYLISPTGTRVVLLNQPGTDIFGADGAGMNITLQDGASTYGSVQNAGNGYLTGSYNAAGSLSAFGSPASPGGYVNGTWELFFADLSSGGGTATLNSWTVTAVPEPVPLALGVFLGLLLARTGWKWIRQARPNAPDNS